jgi:hypothetical protein
MVAAVSLASQIGARKELLKKYKKILAILYFLQMTVKNLAKTLIGMHEREMYKELTFYLTSCESGSMFGDYLPENSQFFRVIYLE